MQKVGGMGYISDKHLSRRAFAHTHTLYVSYPEDFFNPEQRAEGREESIGDRLYSGSTNGEG